MDSRTNRLPVALCRDIVGPVMVGIELLLVTLATSTNMLREEGALSFTSPHFRPAWPTHHYTPTHSLSLGCAPPTCALTVEVVGGHAHIPSCYDCCHLLRLLQMRGEHHAGAEKLFFSLPSHGCQPTEGAHSDYTELLLLPLSVHLFASDF